MASTYSTSLRLELIGTGEQSGTWGTTTNTNLGTLLEQAIGGYQSITMTDADYTLSTANGVVDEARNAVLRFTGTLTAARNVLCPDGIEKVYIVENATTNGFAITFKTVSGTGISIPNGAEAILFADGTNVRMVTNITSAGAALLDDADAAAQRTTLGLGTGDSPQFTAVNIGNASDTTLSRVSAGVAAIEGKNIALNGTSETFTTGTIELGNASDTTLSRVSAGVAAIEGKNIALNGTSETFTTGTIELGNASDTTITRSAAGVIAVEGGVIPKENRINTFSAGQIISTGATQPDLTLKSNAGTFKTFTLVSGTTARWVWGSDNAAESGGNAGSNFFMFRYNDAGVNIGTPISVNRATGLTTLESLQVNGASVISVTDNTNAALRITQLGTGNAILVEDSTNPDSTPFVVDQLGRVGIGTTTPTTRLDLSGPGSGDPAIRLSDGTVDFRTYVSGGAAYCYTAGNHSYEIGTNNTLRMRVTGAGNVGIGTSSPNKRLSVINAGSTQFTIDTTAGANDVISFDTYNASAVAGIYTWSQQGTERMRIDSAGNVGIGTSSPGTKLDVNGNINSGGTIQSAGGVTFRKTANIPVTNALTLGTVSKSTVPAGGQGSILIYSDDATNSLQGSVSLITSATASERRLAIGAVEQSVAFRNITLAELGGNVGIGTTSPSERLYVVGPSGGTSALFTDNVNSTLYIKHESPGNLLTYESGGTASQRWITNSAERMRIDSSGNVGIGKTPVNGMLDVNGRVSAATGYSLPNDQPIFWGPGDGTTSIYGNSTSDFIYFNTAGAERLRITSAGNVGIGASTPGATGFTSFLALGNNNAGIGNVGTNIIGIATNNAERMRIDASGRLLVGTSTALDATGIVPLVQSATADNQAGFGAFRYSNNSPGPLLHFFKSRGTTVGTNTIVQNGDVLGNIAFYGADGTNEILGANIQAVVDGTPGTNDMPGRIEFATTPDGASAPTTRFRISANGDTLNVSTGGLGYGTGSGGTVTQATSKTTGVTLNKTNGRITMNNAALAAGAAATFSLSNTTIATTDTVILSGYWGAVSALGYRIEVIHVYTSGCDIRVTNITGGSLSEALEFNFAVIKAVTS